MRVRTALAIASLPLLHGCFFFYVPGSFIQAASDGLSGAEGSHCVSATARVGDSITLPNSGAPWTVVSLSGTSSRCTNPDQPIRAKLAPT